MKILKSIKVNGKNYTVKSSSRDHDLPGKAHNVTIERNGKFYMATIIDGDIVRFIRTLMDSYGVYAGFRTIKIA